MLCRANEPHVVLRYLLPSDTHNLFPPSPPLGLLHTALVLLGKWNDKGSCLVGFLYYANAGDLFLSMLRVFASVTLIAYLRMLLHKDGQVRIKGKTFPRVSLGLWAVLCRRVPIRIT